MSQAKYNPSYPNQWFDQDAGKCAIADDVAPDAESDAQDESTESNDDND